jgi:hypothetical protein
MKKLLLRCISACFIVSISLIACEKNLSSKNDRSADSSSLDSKSKKSKPEGITFYALAGNTLDKYSTANPEAVLNSATITGLQSGEKILGIDFRPATGELYALGSNSRLYTVNPSTGVASFVAVLSVALNGTSFGFDFNPAVDRIRIISSTGQNLRANPITGATLVDVNINPGPASVTSAAYDNNDNDPATPTELYALDATTSLLYEIDPPNAGTLIEPIAVKLKLEGDGGFDIAPRNGNVTSDIGLALYEVNKKSTLFEIDVETGETKILAKYTKSIMYSAIAISPEL